MYYACIVLKIYVIKIKLKWGVQDLQSVVYLLGIYKKYAPLVCFEVNLKSNKSKHANKLL